MKWFIPCILLEEPSSFDRVIENDTVMGSIFSSFITMGLVFELKSYHIMCKVYPNKPSGGQNRSEQFYMELNPLSF